MFDVRLWLWQLKDSFVATVAGIIMDVMDNLWNHYIDNKLEEHLVLLQEMSPTSLLQDCILGESLQLQLQIVLHCSRHLVAQFLQFAHKFMAENYRFN